MRLFLEETLLVEVLDEGELNTDEELVLRGLEEKLLEPDEGPLALVEDLEPGEGLDVTDDLDFELEGEL